MKIATITRGLAIWSMGAMLVMTVFLSAGAIEHSYQLAQLQERSEAMQQQEQVLREKLARAQSLRSVRAYAEAQGYVARGTASTTLSVSLAALSSPLAQQQ